MVKRIQSVMNWLQQPDFEDQEDNLSALYIQSIALVSIVVALILGVVYAAVGQIGYVAFMAADILIQIVMIGLVRSKKIRSASNLFLVVALVLLTLGILSAGSIHASSVMLYPILLLFASLLIDRKSYTVYVLLCIASIGFIVYAENQKLAPPYMPDRNKRRIYCPFHHGEFAKQHSHIPAVCAGTLNPKCHARPGGAGGGGLSDR
jgi:hypothetical protein